MAQSRIENGVVHSLASPLTFLSWLKILVIHPAIFSAYAKVGDHVDTPPPVDPDHIFLGSLLKTYPIDGNVASTTQLVTAKGELLSIKDLTDTDVKLRLSVFLLLTIFGLPSRLGDMKQIVRNFFGGWDSIEFGYEGKRFWNFLLLPVKVIVIFSVKLLGICIKIFINMYKIFTEFLPELILNVTGKWIGKLLRDLTTTREEAHQAELLNGQYSWLSVILSHILGFIGFVFLLPVHYIARMWGFFGEAMTSPEKSARNAWEFGARVRPQALGYVLGTLGAALCITVTSVLWMIAMPLAISEFARIYPDVTSILALIAQWPVITSILAKFGIAVNSAFITIESLTVFAIIAPILTICSRIADELSNGWARWEADMNFAEGMIAIFVQKSSDASLNMELKPSHSSQSFKLKAEQSFREVESRFDQLDNSQTEKLVYFKKAEQGYTEFECEAPHYISL